MFGLTRKEAKEIAKDVFYHLIFQEKNNSQPGGIVTHLNIETLMGSFQKTIDQVDERLRKLEDAAKPKCKECGHIVEEFK